MTARTHAVIELGREQLRAVWGAYQNRNHDLLEVQGVVVEQYPADLDRDDAEALGAWAGEQLRAYGFPFAGGSGKVVMALGRELVALKCLKLPGASEDDLPEMTRLALRRELSFDAEHAVIDFVPLDNGENGATVLAVAAPARALEFCRQAGQAAGLSLGRVTLRSLGMATVVGGGGAAMLAIDVVREAVDFCMVEDGVIRFSRAAALTPHDEPGVIAEQVATETRRTWMSYRITEEARGADRVVLLGERAVIDHAREPIGEMMRLPAEMVEGHSRVRDGGHDLSCVWPLVGLLLEAANEGTGGTEINFLSPRRAPDRGAGKRRRILAAAVLGALLMVVLWWTGQNDLQTLRADLYSLEKTRKKLLVQNAEFFRRRYRLEHLERWETASPDWLAHIRKLDALSPPASDLVLDSWTGALDFRGVKFDKKTKKWSAPRELNIVLDGEARDRSTADTFRAALVKDSLYKTSSSGSEAGGGKRLPVGFTYRLRTDTVNPPATDITPSAAEAGP